MKYSHLFFDLDGTLWDLPRNTRAALEMLFQKHADQGLQSLDFERFLRIYMKHNERVWALYRDGKIEKEYLRYIRFQRTFDDMKAGQPKAFVDSFALEFMDICPRQPHLVEGARRVLDHFRDRCELHIITNGFSEVQGLKLEAGGITEYFGEIINSEHCGARKPHREIFQFAMKNTGAVPASSLMIGDDWEADILGARDFGMDQAWLRNGIGSHNYSPTYVLDSLEDLVALI